VLKGYVVMRVYLTDSQVPEVRALPAAVRRLVIRRALGIMRSRARLFCWLPTLLCVIGGFSGSLLGGPLLDHFHQAPAFINVDWTTQCMIWSYSGVAIGAFTAGFIGLQLQRWKLRAYLGSVIDNCICEITQRA
jgi:hypothetical protein